MRPLLMCTLAASLCVAGCYNAKIRAPVQPQGELISRVGVSFLWGLTNSNTDALECSHGMAYTEIYHPWWGVLFVQPLTLGIVTPLRKVYQCAAPPVAPAAPQVLVMQAPGAVAPAPAGPVPARPAAKPE